MRSLNLWLLMYRKLLWNFLRLDKLSQRHFYNILLYFLFCFLAFILRCFCCHKYNSFTVLKLRLQTQTIYMIRRNYRRFKVSRRLRFQNRFPKVYRIFICRVIFQLYYPKFWLSTLGFYRMLLQGALHWKHIDFRW